MRKIQLLILFTAFSFAALAQSVTMQKVNIENTDGKVHIKIEREVDGKTITIDKTYNGKEEMKNDPELEGLNIHLLDGSSHDMTFLSKGGEDGKHEVKIIVDVDSDNATSTSKAFFFDSEKGDDAHDIKVWVDEDGMKHVYKNGEEIKFAEGDSWTDKDGNEFNIKKGDDGVIIMSTSDINDLINEDGGTFEFKFDDENLKDGEHKVMKFKSADGESLDDNSFTVKVVKHIIVRLEDLENNDLSTFDGVDTKSLKMDELNFYPNPNDGRFTLQFKANKRPTQLKITSLDGKSIYEENLQGFEGTYQNEIDLSSQKKGIYLLQIIQGNKATNKKIVIE